jgi:hypothetical protein
MNLLLISTAILSLIIIIFGIFLLKLLSQVKTLSQGKSGSSLESILLENNTLLRENQKKLHDQEQEIQKIQKDSLKNVQNIGVIRFNPFKETGGSQSFALALTNKENSGVVISSLYSRDRINVFAKPIIQGVSEYTLTKEEQEAITKSRN